MSLSFVIVGFSNDGDMIVLLRLFTGLSRGGLALLFQYTNHVSQSVSENSRVIIKALWDFNVYTDHELSAWHPDIVVVNKEEASVQIINVAVPADSNVTSKEAVKVEKYRDLFIELMSLWKRKYEIILIVVGCLGYVTRVLKSNLRN